MKIDDLTDKCIVCGYRGATKFEDGWFHMADKARPWRHCRDLYLTAKREIELRRVAAWDSIDSVGYGWRGILTNLVMILLKIDPKFEIHQIKEKFGGLRFYVGEMSVLGHQIIEWAEARSNGVCEACGDWGEPTGGREGWIKTLCDRCTDLRNQGERPWLGLES